MKRYYVAKSDVDAFVKKLTERMAAKNLFCNVKIEEYKGNKYDKDNTVVVVVG